MAIPMAGWLPLPEIWMLFPLGLNWILGPAERVTASFRQLRLFTTPVNRLAFPETAPLNSVVLLKITAPVKTWLVLSRATLAGSWLSAMVPAIFAAFTPPAWIA